MKTMKILDATQLNILRESGASVALGTFDGVHMGHRHILRLAKENANGMPVVCFTFENIPASLFDESKLPIFTVEEKLEALREEGIDYVYIPRFTRKFAKKSYEEFLDILRDDLSAKVVTCGFNYSFGHMAKGRAEDLEKYAAENGMKAFVCDSIEYGTVTVSSTRIRREIMAGNIEEANHMLGRPFTLSGEVIGGKRLGNKIGFPTINFAYPHKITAKRGVYISRTAVDGVYYPAITNIGLRPTVEDTDKMNVETHIIGFEGDLYGRMMDVQLYSFLREEKRFSGIDGLINQLEKDKKIALQYDFCMIE